MRVIGLVGHPRTALSVLAAAALILPVSAAPDLATNDWSKRVWASASTSTEIDFLDQFEDLRGHDEPTFRHVLDSADLLEQGFVKREEQRDAKIAEVRAELVEALNEPESPLALSKALKSAVELHMISREKDALLQEPKIQDLVRRAEAAAEQAEIDADWIIASELISRLDALFENDGRYKDYQDRLTQRLLMIRLYNPERLWDLRDQRRVDEGEEPLPPYNPLNDRYEDKLDGIRPQTVMMAIGRAGNEHIDSVPIKDMILAGLRNMQLMATTPDLVPAFPALAPGPSRDALLSHLDDQIKNVEAATAPLGRSELRSVLGQLLSFNDELKLMPEEALLHEFGNGAFTALDPFSGFIWPDELKRFRRNTQGSFVGVGIQIQLDDLFHIKVVTPIEGTPAQRAGIRANDLIIEVDGQPTTGFTIDQAVETITGPAGSSVTLTLERPADEEDAEPTLHDVRVTRANIPLPSVKGWRRVHTAEEKWDWFVDPVNGIGYIRLPTGFTEQTTKELLAAVREMREQRPLNGLIFDLRHNPGGLLDQAISVANLFIEQGTIVSTTHTRHEPGRSERARRSNALLADLPIAVLINEGSASASEIVAGALQDHAHDGDVRAVVVGQRSFGKGSVQNVWMLDRGNAALKLTTAHYQIPSGRIIHREPGDDDWGVTPDLEVEMLPDQIVDALTLRRDADLISLNEHGNIIEVEDRPNPDSLIQDGLDLQLHAALVLLQSQSLPVLARAETAVPATP